MSQICNCVSCPSLSKSIMSDIPEKVLNELASLKVNNDYKKGQSIFYEGNKPYGVYCLKSGKVKLYKTNTDGKDLILKIATGGDLLGYRYFFTNEFYSSTAEVLEDASVCFLDKELFMGLLKKHPLLSGKLLDLMGQEIKNAENNLQSIAYNSTNERVITILLQLKEKYGVKYDDNSYKIDVSLSRSDLADLTGTSTETLVRVMSWLKEKHLVNTENKVLCISDFQALEKLVPKFN